MAAVVAAAGCNSSGPEAQASTPSLTWAGAERVGVQCVISSTLGGAQDLRSALCERVRALASVGAPVPVGIIGAGDPALLNAGTVTLLVHASLRDAASLTPGASGRLLAFSIRPFRVSAENAVLFGAAPQMVLLKTSNLEGGTADAAISAALSELLPWRATAPGAGAPLN